MTLVASASPETKYSETKALFREARRRKRKRRLSLLGVTVVLLGSLVAYLTANQPAQHPESLLSRQLHFPSLAADGSCPATLGQPVRNSFFNGVALGNGPVRVLVGNNGDLLKGHAVLGTSDSSGWFALQTLWFSVPRYDGPFVVRAKRLGASSPIRVQSGGLVPDVSGPLVVPAGPTINTRDGYRTIAGSTWVTSPGCYAWQVDGRNFSEMITVDAVAP